MGLNMTSIPKGNMGNQLMVTDKMEELKRLTDSFKSPIKVSFGYGSGVFEQASYHKKKTRPQIDLIYVVDNARDFHEQNLKQHNLHYSGIKYLGGLCTILAVQSFGAGVYFNPYVMMNTTGSPVIVKYGITTVELCLKDLVEWSNFYVAGRLQKPVAFMKDNDPRFLFANQYNLKSATALALLMIKSDTFDEIKLFESIAKLSYMGDPRMFIGGENPNKVKNIVSKQVSNFRKLYNPFLQYFQDNGSIESVQQSNTRGLYQKHLDTAKKAEIIDALPIQFKRRLYKLYAKSLESELSRDSKAQRVLDSTYLMDDLPTGHFTLAIAKDAKLPKNLRLAVSSTVAIPALLQTIKGMFTAGLTKSVKYAWEKNLKYRNG